MNSVTIDNITAWIEVEDQPATVYQLEIHARKKTAEAWIASETGKRFKVCWKDTLNTYHTVGDVRVDGRYCGGTLHRTSGGAGTTIFKDGIRDSLASRRPFVFAQLEVTDDDRHLDDPLKGLGDIMLKVKEVTDIQPLAFHATPTIETPKVHERAKKAVAQHVGLGAARPTKAYGRSKSKRIRTIARFTFHYRPLGTSIDLLFHPTMPALPPYHARQPAPYPNHGSHFQLLADDIAPPPERAVRRAVAPPTASIDDDEEEEERIRKLEAELAALRARKKVKKEVKAEVKLEERIDLSGDVIDLTMMSSRSLGDTGGDGGRGVLLALHVIATGDAMGLCNIQQPLSPPALRATWCLFTRQSEGCVTVEMEKDGVQAVYRPDRPGRHQHYSVAYDESAAPWGARCPNDNALRHHVATVEVLDFERRPVLPAIPDGYVREVFGLRYVRLSFKSTRLCVGLGVQAAMTIAAVATLARKSGRAWILVTFVVTIFLASTAIELIAVRVLSQEVALFRHHARGAEPQIYYPLMVNGICLCICVRRGDLRNRWEADVWSSRARSVIAGHDWQLGAVIREVEVSPQARAFGRVVFTPKSLAFTLPLVITNVLATALVGIQVWAYRRDVVASLGPFSSGSRVGGILLLLLESGVMFCVMCITIVVLVAYAPPMANVNAIVVVTDVLQFSVGAYATFVILVVTVYQHRTAISMIQGQSSFMASIRFVSPASGTDASSAGLPDGDMSRIEHTREGDAIEMTSRRSR
ncbi:uncharacterized protein SCHCODRAFT_02510815 [Schizophyllum commune H4-8]|nr:uncharacterized protein SCHCODRAFT_02510815 [Schizophyllum commune H4-8]KAI5888914.1 hypothetical protein SCHCODRAFT_02510815 [Schizophyllum commune H4-8]